MVVRWAPLDAVAPSVALWPCCTLHPQCCRRRICIPDDHRHDGGQRHLHKTPQSATPTVTWRHVHQRTRDALTFWSGNGSSVPERKLRWTISTQVEIQTYIKETHRLQAGIVAWGFCVSFLSMKISHKFYNMNKDFHAWRRRVNISTIKPWNMREARSLPEAAFKE